MYYEYNPESIDDILKVMAANAKKRRLEKGWTRKYLCERSDVPVSTIAKFESLHTISLASYVAIAKALRHEKAHVRSHLHHNEGARHHQQQQKQKERST